MVYATVRMLMFLGMGDWVVAAGAIGSVRVSRRALS